MPKINRRPDCPVSVNGSITGVQPGGGGSIPTTGLFRKDEWIVDTCSHRVAKKLISEHHYSRWFDGFIVYATGLYRRDDPEKKCYGCTIWSTAVGACGLKYYPKAPKKVLSLSRLVIVPGVPKGACSFLLRHTTRHFIDKDKWPFLLTFADEWRGHAGIIYQAAGWTFAGYTKPRPIYLKNGELVSKRTFVGIDNPSHDYLVNELGCKAIKGYRCKAYYFTTDKDYIAEKDEIKRLQQRIHGKNGRHK